MSVKRVNSGDTHAWNCKMSLTWVSVWTVQQGLVYRFCNEEGQWAQKNTSECEDEPGEVCVIYSYFCLCVVCLCNASWTGRLWSHIVAMTWHSDLTWSEMTQRRKILPSVQILSSVSMCVCVCVFVDGCVCVCGGGWVGGCVCVCVWWNHLTLPLLLLLQQQQQYGRILNQLRIMYTVGYSLSLGALLLALGILISFRYDMQED